MVPRVPAGHCQSKIDYFARTSKSYFVGVDFPSSPANIGSSRYGPLPVLFSQVLRLQLTQQCPRENDGQYETHENAKDDENRSHERLRIRPPSPSNNTTAPIINATNPTYFCSKSCAITTEPRSYSFSETSID